jgi:hypothetical protein
MDLNRLDFIDDTAQILADVSNFHRRGGFVKNRYRQAAAWRVDFFDACRKPNRRHPHPGQPQIGCRRFRRRESKPTNMIFSSHEKMEATRAPESFTTASPFTEPSQKFSVDAAEAAIAENDHDIAALHNFGDVRDNGICIRQIRRGFSAYTDLLHQFFRVKSFFGREQFEPRDLRNDDGICICKRRRQFILKNIPARRVRARLKDCTDFFARIFDAQRA